MLVLDEGQLFVCAAEGDVSSFCTPPTELSRHIGTAVPGVTWLRTVSVKRLSRKKSAYKYEAMIWFTLDIRPHLWVDAGGACSMNREKRSIHEKRNPRGNNILVVEFVRCVLACKR